MAENIISKIKIKDIDYNLRAIKAIQDGDGNVITDTYEKKITGSAGDFVVIDNNGNVTTKTGSNALDGVLKYTEQTLTEEQQVQARENINAQNVINLQGMAVFEGSGVARTAIEYQDYAPAYSGLINLTRSTTLTDTYMGRFIDVNSSSACTITLPSVPATHNEMEIMNLGAGEVTISGSMQLGITGIVLSQGDAVTLKSNSSYWCVIGSYKEV